MFRCNGIAKGMNWGDDDIEAAKTWLMERVIKKLAA